MQAPAPNRLSLLASARGWWRNAVARHGRRHAARRLLGEVWGFLRDSTPDRRRRRYGDVDYDWDHRVDTTSATVSIEDRLLGVFHSPYQPTAPALFWEMIESLHINHEQFVFLDLGSGKGRTLLMASEYPFQRIIGVELLPKLHAVARENIRTYKSDVQKCFRVETILGDARRYEIPNQSLLVYLFNPFPEAIFEEVISHLEDSLRRNPRPVYVLYHNPLLEHLLARSLILRKTAGTHQYVVYANVDKDPFPVKSAEQEVPGA